MTGPTLGVAQADPSACHVVLEVGGAAPMDHAQAQAMAGQLEQWLAQGAVREELDAVLARGPWEALEGWDCMAQCLPPSGPVLTVACQGVATAGSARFSAFMTFGISCPAPCSC